MPTRIGPGPARALLESGPAEPLGALLATDPCAVLRFEAGEVVLREGEVSDAVYFVLSGRVAVSRDERSSRQSVGSTGPGHFVGEEGVIDKKPRNATVEAASPCDLLRIEGPVFLRWLREAPALDAMTRLQRQLYRGPDGQLLIAVGAGEHGGQPCVTSHVHDPNGRSFASTCIVGTSHMIWQLLPPPAQAPRLVAGPAGRRLSLDADRCVVRVEVEGEMDGVEALVLRLVRGRPLPRALEQRFRNSGHLGVLDKKELICLCVGLTYEQARRLPAAELQERTGAGTVCGRCRGPIDAMGGEMTAPQAVSDLPRTPYPRFVEQVVTGEIRLPSQLQLRQELEQAHPELFEPARPLRGLLHYAALWGGGVGLAVAMLQALAYDLHVALPVLVVLQATLYYRATALLHDMAHGATFRRPALNAALGVPVAWLLLGSFRAFRAAHLEHHRLNQSRQDPKFTRVPPELPWPEGVVAFIRWVTVDLYARLPRRLAEAALAGMMLIFIAPTLLVLQEFSGLRWPRDRLQLLDLMGLLLTWGTLLALLGPVAVAVVLLAPALLGLSLLSLVFFTHSSEHTLKAMEHHGDERELMIFNITDLSVSPAFDAFALGFHRYHVAHHLFPDLSYDRLPAASRFVRERYGSLLLPVQPASFDFVKRGFVDHVFGWETFQVADRIWIVGPTFDAMTTAGRTADP